SCALHRRRSGPTEGSFGPIRARSVRWARPAGPNGSARPVHRRVILPGTSLGSGGGLLGAQLAGPGEHRVEHLLGETPGEGVLLADVVAADEGPPAGQADLDAVAEAGPGAQGPVAEDAQSLGEAEPAESDDHPEPAEQVDLGIDPRSAVVALHRRRLVLRGRALDRC